MHGCVKRMADAILDLLVPSTADRVVTRSNGDASALGDEVQCVPGGCVVGRAADGYVVGVPRVDR